MQNRILVIRLGKLGDVILASASVINLRIAFPEAHITFLTGQEFAPIVRMMSAVNELVTFPRGGNALALFKLTIELEKSGFDTVVDLHANFRSWFVRKTIKAITTVVYPKRRIERHLIVRRRKKLTSVRTHTIDQYNETVRVLGGRICCRRPRLTAGRTVWRSKGEKVPGPVVSIIPGARHEPKKWPMERYVAVAQQLTERTGASINWILTESDSRQLDGLITLNRDREGRYVDRPLAEVTRLLGDSRLALANDSGIMHLASALNVPTLAVFGPTHPVLGFAPRGLNDQICQTDEFCRPCSRHGSKPCYREEQFCFTKLSSETVAERAIGMLENSIQRQPAMFIDRDGTLIVEKKFLSDPDGVQLIDGAAESLRAAREQGYKIVIVSNQSGVARGYFGIDEVERVNNRIVELLSAEGLEIDGVYYCPHHKDGTVSEFSIDCDCRKPAPAMVEEAAGQLGIDLTRSVVIGDKVDDYMLGVVAGAQSILVRTGFGENQETMLKGSPFYREEAVFDDLPKAVSNFISA